MSEAREPGQIAESPLAKVLQQCPRLHLGKNAQSWDEVATWLLEHGVDVRVAAGAGETPQEPMKFEDAMVLEYPSGNWAGYLDAALVADLVPYWNAHADENQVLRAAPIGSGLGPNQQERRPRAGDRPPAPSEVPTDADWPPWDGWFSCPDCLGWFYGEGIGYDDANEVCASCAEKRDAEVARAVRPPPRAAGTPPEGT